MTNKTPKSESAPVPLRPDEIDTVSGAMVTNGASGNVAGGTRKGVTRSSDGAIVLINSHTPMGSLDGPIRLPF